MLQKRPISDYNMQRRGRTTAVETHPQASLQADTNPDATPTAGTQTLTRSPADSSSKLWQHLTREQHSLFARDAGARHHSGSLRTQRNRDDTLFFPCLQGAARLGPFSRSKTPLVTGQHAILRPPETRQTSSAPLTSQLGVFHARSRSRSTCSEVRRGDALQRGTYPVVRSINRPDALMAWDSTTRVRQTLWCLCLLVTAHTFFVYAHTLKQL